MSLKLIQQLREQGAKVTPSGPSGGGDASGKGSAMAAAGRTFREVVLNEPIRWGGCVGTG